MSPIYFILILVAVIYQSESLTEKLQLPTWGILKHNSKFDEDGYPIWEGDILFHGNNKNDVISERNARKDLNSRWPQGRIPYKIDSTLNQQESRSAITEAMQLWMDNTCVTFVNSPTIQVRDQPHLVLKQAGTGCNSWVGIQDEYITNQTLSLDGDCSTVVGTIAHELGHAIGLWHTQDRLDRDSYLEVYKNNMGSNSIYFETANNDVMHYDVPYEYTSIMQYPPDAFNNNGKLTLVPKDPMALPHMGNFEKITHLDFKLVNRMYNCSDNRCKNPPSCQNGGYATWNNKKGCRCECPAGFNGPNCQSRVHVEPPCGRKITTSTRFQTANYPDNHSANLRCAWLIEAPRGKVPQLFFHDFSLMGRAEIDNKCYWSALRVRNGNLMNDDPGEIYCADDLHQRSIRGKSNQILLVFTTAYDGARGFDISVTFV